MTPPFYFLYRAVVWPVLYGGFATASLFNDKISVGFKMRGQNSHRPWLKSPKDLKPVWIHCASGEFEYAKPVIRLLKERNPDQKILVTYFSPTFAAAVEKFPGVDFACPIPWDTRKELKEFIDHHRPVAFAIARTDTWPEVLRQTHIHGIPSILFSATLSPTSGRAKGLGKISSKTVLGQLSEIFAVTEDDASEFKKLLGDKVDVQVAGDTRYDQVLARIENPKPLRDEIFEYLSERPTLVCGSTWSEDETVLLDAYKDLKLPLQLILVPHEPIEDHLVELETEIQNRGLKSIRYSQTFKAPRSNEVLIVDQVGILAELFLKADIAFVGGSFKKTVHSVMEPLAAGCVTIVGPKHLNNREALEFKAVGLGDGTHCVEVANTSGQLAVLLKRLTETPKPELREKIRAQIRARSGKSKLVVDWIENHFLRG